jgi:hypothetical protein
MVTVFKTNVEHPADVMRILDELLDKYPAFIISLDMGDEDKILRVEGNFFDVEDIIALLQLSGFTCIHLPLDPNS